MDSLNRMANPEIQLNEALLTEQREQNDKLGEEVTKLSAVVRGFLGKCNMGENPATDSTLGMFLDKMRQLEVAWCDNEKKFNVLQTENEQLQMKLLTEKNKCAIYQKRLQFIQENKTHFEKLKEVYTKMKQMEVQKCNSKMNIMNKSTQSESIMASSSSYITCSVASQVNNIVPMSEIEENPSQISIPRLALSKAQDTIGVLKELIQRREQSWGLNRERHLEFVRNLKRLEIENASLRNIVSTHCCKRKETTGTSMACGTSGLDNCKIDSDHNCELTCTEMSKTNMMENVSLTMLQDIVRKLEMRNRELEQMNSNNPDYNIFHKTEKDLRKKIEEEHELQNTQTSSGTTSSIHRSEISNPSGRGARKREPTKCASTPFNQRKPAPFPSRVPASSQPRKQPQQQQQPSPQQAVYRERANPKRSTQKVETASLNPPPSRQESEHSEVEILRQIKADILRKQANISRKLELVQSGFDAKQKRNKSRSLSLGK